MNPHTLLRSTPRPDQEGIPLNATPCQRPWVIAAQSHDPPDSGFDGSITRHLMISFSRARESAGTRIQETKSGCCRNAMASHAVARHYSCTRAAGRRRPHDAQSGCVGQEGTSPYCQRPRRQHGQHHASHHSDRRDHRSRWRLVRPGTLVLALPFLWTARLIKDWRRAPAALRRARQ